MTLTDSFKISSELASFKKTAYLTPEQLNNKINSLTGLRWIESQFNKKNNFTENYNLYLGGIDSDAIT